MVLLSVGEQTHNIVSAEAIYGIIGTLLGIIVGSIITYLLPKLGSIRFSVSDYHSEYYNNDKEGFLSEVVNEKDAEGFYFDCNLYVYNSKNISTSINKAYIEIICDNKTKLKRETLTNDLNNIAANELKVQKISVQFEQEHKKIALGSVKKVYIKYYLNGKRFEHRKKLIINKFNYTR